MNAYYNYNNIPQENNNDLYVSPVQKQKKKSGGKIAALALCFSLLGGAIGTGGTYLVMNSSNKPSAVAAATDSSKAESEKKTDKEDVVLSNSKSTQTIDTQKAMTASELYKANVNSTVGITTSISTNYYGYKTTAAASGSGFIVSKDGYIVTNHHVIADANKITVTLYDGKKYNAELIGSDESNDVAVLKIDAQNLTPVTLGSSAGLEVGEDVVAIGNPLGELTFSLTKGIVSALDRSVTIENKNMTLIQTDTAINSGNSGGALFNMYGEVIGITNARCATTGSSASSGYSVDNICFAIPIDNVKAIINSLIDGGSIVKPYIGVGANDVGKEEKSDGVVTEGSVIKKIYEDSPAESAGLKVGDIVTEINGKAIKSSGEMTSAVKASNKGDKLVMKVYRDGKFIEITVIVGETSDGTTQTEKDQQNTQKNNKKQDQDQDDFDDRYGGYGGFDDYDDLPLR